MNYTIVVLTRAESDFDAEKFLHGIEEEPPTGSEVEGPQDDNGTTQEPSQSYPLIKKFLIDDIERRVIGVNNVLRSQYKRTGMRDVVIELIDVVQTEQQGKPFSHLYFDKAEDKLMERRDEEEKARAQFEEEECQRWEKLLQKAEKKLDQLLNKYCKDLQVKALNDMRQRDNLVQAIVEDLTSFKTALSKVIEVLHQFSDIKWPFNSTLKEYVKSRLPKAVQEATPHVTQGFNDEYKSAKDKTDTNLRQEEEIEAKLASMDEEIDDEIKEEEKIIFHQMKSNKLQNEYALVRGYMDQVTDFETHRSVEQTTLAKLHAESGKNFANILTDVRDAVRAYLSMMDTHLGMDFSDDQIKHLVEPALKETVDDLLRELEKEEHKATYKGRFTWWIKKKLTHQKKRTTQESNGEEATEYVKQAIEYLVNRQLSIIRLQRIPRKIDCRQMLEEVNVSDKKKTRCKSAFYSLPKFHAEEGKQSSTEEIQEQIAEVHRKKLLLGLEENSEKRKELNEELNALNKKMEDKREGYKKKIHDSTYSLTNTVRDLVLKYAESKTKGQLDKIMKNDYKDVAENLSTKVAEQLPEAAKTYFSEDRIGAAIKIYAELDHKVLQEMAQEVKKCFPADAMVVEKTKGQMKMCDVRVGDRLLTASRDGTLLYEDIFMLGEYLKKFTYCHQIEHSAELPSF